MTNTVFDDWSHTDIEFFEEVMNYRLYRAIANSSFDKEFLSKILLSYKTLRENFIIQPKISYRPGITFAKIQKELQENKLQEKLYITKKNQKETKKEKEKLSNLLLNLYEKFEKKS